MLGSIIILIMGIMAVLGGAPLIGLILIIVALYFLIPKLKYKKEVNSLDISKEDMDKAKKKKEELLNKTTKAEPIKKEELTYEEWVKNVKANKIYKDKDFFEIDNLGLLWYEKGKYHLYLVNTTKTMYKKCLKYTDGLITSNKIDIEKETTYEKVVHNNKFKGAVAGAMLAGTAGAVAGQNLMENTTEIREDETNFYLVIDGNKLKIENSDAAIIENFIIENKK